MNDTLTVTEFVAIAGVAIAFFGALFGWFAHRREVRRDKVRLRLRVGNGVGVVPGTGVTEKFLTIVVVNLSSFPVTIANMGFSDAEVCMYPPLERIETPFRLPPREAKTIYYPRSCYADEKRVRGMKCAFAETECGEHVEIRRIERHIEEFLRNGK
jgi:hypothetical protein